ncbi:cytochrome P450 87A3-like [Magnolia sinica]|uniref:cytochrome P450 87A3-like n=1 Tax=Magnolia sinica TaxID=86752 RepID=UPI002659BF55|nr:cytochrome P450 87A3-like [Magnolia sinica]
MALVDRSPSHLLSMTDGSLIFRFYSVYRIIGHQKRSYVPSNRNPLHLQLPAAPSINNEVFAHHVVPREQMGSIEVCIVTLFIIWISSWIYKWGNPKCNGKVPPGSMGFPLLGETLSFFSSYTASDVHPFVKTRMERYGPIFKTCLVGQPLIVSTDQDFNQFIFQQEGRLFQSWWPETFREILGPQNIGSMHGFLHKYLKGLTKKLLGVETLKQSLLPEVDQFARTTLSSWTTQPSIEVKEATSAMIFDLTAKRLISYHPSTSSENLRDNFVAFLDGLISFPINIPGSPFYKCMQGRQNAMRMLKNMLEERRASPEKGCGDFFDYVIDELKKEGSALSEGMALDMMFVMLFASFETTSSALTVAMKLLTDHPHVVEKLTEEHEEILKRREDPDSRITWEEYKSMTFTSQVINEAVRLANIAPGIFRKTTDDVKIKGYTIPAGWAVMVCPPAVHLNPETFVEPLKFNPWRWEGMDTNRGSKNFMAFGGGMRLCVGADFSRLQMTVFLHHLVTKYRWIAVKGGETLRSPGLSFPNGFHIQLFQKRK